MLRVKPAIGDSSGRRASTESTATETSSAMLKSISTDSLVSITSIDGSRSSLDSFAKLCVRRRGSNRAERGASFRSTKLVMEPYFSPFAGQSLIFDMRKTDTTGVVNVK